MHIYTHTLIYKGAFLIHNYLVPDEGDFFFFPSISSEQRRKKYVGHKRLRTGDSRIHTCSDKTTGAC